MGRKRDRLDAVDWPPRLDVPAFHLDRLAASEAAGVGRVGDAVLPPGARGARRGPRCGHLVHAVRSAGERGVRERGGRVTCPHSAADPPPPSLP